MKRQPPCNKEHLLKITSKHKAIGISETLIELFWRLYDHFGTQRWWPGETPFEIAVGAILTQNTSWTNVEKAISRLKEKDLLRPERLAILSNPQLAEIIRPAGYYNIKAKRLKNFLKFLIDDFEGDLNLLAQLDTDEIRQSLLNINGIGPETADSITLYALNKPSFVIDAYTMRILLRHDLIDEDSNYHQVRELFMENLPQDQCLFNEFHALFVRLGKDFCKKKQPNCLECPLNDF